MGRHRQTERDRRLHCSHCGTENQPDAYSCARCGERLYVPDPEHGAPMGAVGCQSCSASNEAHARYCWKCGVSLESAVRLSPQAATAARPTVPPAAPRPRREAPPPPPPRPTESPPDLRGAPDRANDSGTRNAALPDELRGWNWGAFLIGPIWGIGNRVWIALLPLLLIFMPQSVVVLTLIVYGAFGLLLGYKGNEWAWRARRWESTEQFKRAQRTWVTWGVVFLILMTILILAFQGGDPAGVPTS